MAKHLPAKSFNQCKGVAAGVPLPGEGRLVVRERLALLIRSHMLRLYLSKQRRQGRARSHAEACRAAVVSWQVPTDSWRAERRPWSEDVGRRTEDGGRNEVL